MAMASEVNMMSDMWDELAEECLNEEFNLDIPLEVDTCEKYRDFLWRTNTEIKFDKFLHRSLVQMTHVSLPKITLIMRKIAKHLDVFHDSSGQDFDLVVEMFDFFLAYTERLRMGENKELDLSDCDSV